MGVLQRRDLHPALVDQLGMGDVEPAILDRLAMQVSTGIGGGERDLDRVRIDLGGKADSLLDRFLGFSGKTEDEGSVDCYSELVAILREAAGVVCPHFLFSVFGGLLGAPLSAAPPCARPLV